MSQHSLPVQTFMQEAAETLETLETRLLELEGDPGNAEIVDAVFRCLHTLKGSGEMFGFSALARFTHVFENAYDAVRDGRAQVTPELIELSFRSQDHIQRLIEIGNDEAANAAMTGDATGRALLDGIEALLGAGAGAAPAPAEQAAPGTAPLRRVHLRFAPEPAAFRNGLRPDLLVEELETLGTARVQASAAAVPPLEEIDAATCHLVWEGTLETAATREEIEDIFLFADEGALSLTDPAGSPEPAPPAAAQTAPPMAPARRHRRPRPRHRPASRPPRGSPRRARPTRCACSRTASTS